MSESSNWLKGSKPSETPGRHNPKVHAEIPGYPVGSTFKTRDELCATGVHAPPRAGIHGTLEDGAYSVVLSYGYEDDVDNGEIFVYTGHGGRDPRLTPMEKIQGKESWSSEQTKDQEWVGGNAALKVSSKNRKPVRVIRGAPRKGGKNQKTYPYAPAEG
ncbi:hypothetical protein D9615_009528 [Tricholomella constricta]|uniref:YDG domain-containing protein n=1 Tax=Tricholomella constricta TaxID=117010 RepID=A0A8H5GVJ7_9AGAR|nr:hypothetical protein D9615_009528 [Tricholomella constricta]